MAQTERPCDDCGIAVPRTSTKGPIKRRCESCLVVHKKAVKRRVARRHYVKNAEAIKAKQAEYRAANPDFIRDVNRRATKKWREANADRHREAENARRRRKSANDEEWRIQFNLKRRLRAYSLTPEIFAEMVDEQSGGCAVCGETPERPDQLHVDHDHSCCDVAKRSCGDCVRGLLCPNCNRGLAVFGDDINKMRAALEYLESSKADEAA